MSDEIDEIECIFDEINKAKGRRQEKSRKRINIERFEKEKEYKEISIE